MVSMNSKIALVIVALIVLAGIGGAVYFTSQTNTGEAQPGQPSGGDQGDGQAATVQSLAELLASGKAQECNFSDENDQSRSEGVMFFGSGKMRGDFTVQSSGQTIRAHMVSDGEVVYSWMDGIGSGSKFKIQSGTSAGTGSQSNTFDVQKNLSWRCKPWRVDASLFVVPSNISFTDLTTLLPSPPTGGIAPVAPTPVKIDCSVCNSLPEASRAQCRSSLGC